MNTLQSPILDSSTATSLHLSHLTSAPTRRAPSANINFPMNLHDGQRGTITPSSTSSQRGFRQVRRWLTAF